MFDALVKLQWTQSARLVPNGCWSMECVCACWCVCVWACVCRKRPNAPVQQAKTLHSNCSGIHKTKRFLGFFFPPRPLGWNELIITFRMNEPFEMLRLLAWKKRSKALQHIKYERRRLQRGGCRPSPQWPSKAPRLLTLPHELEHGIQLWSSFLISLRHWEEIEVKGSQHLMLQKWSHRTEEEKGSRGN